MIPERGAVGKVMIEDNEGRVHVRGGRALRRIAEECRGRGGQGAPLERGDASIGDPLVVEIFGARAQDRSGGEFPGQRGVDAVALEGDAVAITAGIFIEAGHPDREVAVDGPAHVERGAILGPGANLEIQFGDDGAGGLPGDAVDQSAGTAAAEDHRVGTLHHLDAIDVVEVTEILDVVAHAIDEEVRRGTVAAQHRRVAIALALCDADARDIARHLPDISHSLIVDQFPRDDGDGLGHVHERRVGLGRGQAPVDGVGLAFPLPGHGELFHHEGCFRRRQIAGRGGWLSRSERGK